MKNKITASDVFNGLNNFLYEVGHSGKIKELTINNMIEFENKIFFKTSDRGIIIFDKNSMTSDKKDAVYYTDPRIIIHLHKINLEKEIMDIENKIKNLEEEKNDKIRFLSSIYMTDDRNKIIIDGFHANIETNMPVFIHNKNKEIKSE